MGLFLRLVCGCVRVRVLAPHKRVCAETELCISIGPTKISVGHRSLVDREKEAKQLQSVGKCEFEPFHGTPMCASISGRDCCRVHSIAAIAEIIIGNRKPRMDG